MPSGIATANSRQVTAHRFQLKGRSSFNPAPMRAMITTISVNRSVSIGKSSGIGLRAMDGIEKIAAPIAIQTIGSDKGKRRSARGSQATSAIRIPNPVSARM